ncbi:MAG: fatty acid--CoA ligase family protein [Paludibaculum sp.]
MNHLHVALVHRREQPCLKRDEVVSSGADILTLAESLAAWLQRSGTTSVLSEARDPRVLLALLLLAEQQNLRIILARGAESAAQARTCLPVGSYIDGEGVFHALPRDDAAQQPPESSTIHLFTSGTTGNPKIVEHALGTLLGRIGGRSLKKNEGARWLLTYEPHSFAGLQVVLSAVLSNGLLISSTRRDPASAVKTATLSEATHISATPTFWRAFLMAGASGRTLPLRQITLGGEAVDQATLDRLAEAFPTARIVHIFASSEAGALFSVRDGKAGFPAGWLNEPLEDGITLRLRNGVLEALSPNRMKRYASLQPTPSAEDGWLITGDLAEVRGDRVMFLGRADRTVNVGGLKVCPEEIEEFLLGHPAVRDARAFGVASPLVGQLLAAEIVLDPERDPAAALMELRRFCASGLPPHKVPRRIEPVAQVRMAESGKKG